jgi:2',3'-cyclic-nucleotide 2'-phosphodiesterase / 3'-nucleotidase
MRIPFIFILIFSWFFNLSGQEITIRIAATSDVHGALFPHDFLNDRSGSPSLASVQTFVDSVRAIPGANLILLDNGDLIQGTPAAYYANFVQKNRQNLFARTLNHMQFDAATLGNHDIEAGPDVYYRLQREFNFPWLGGNIINTSTGKPAFEPYTIIERDGVKIAVLGLITPGVPGWLPQTLWPGLEFKAITDAAEYWIAHIRQNHQPDAIIGLFHTGMGQTTADVSNLLPENAGHQTAVNVRGLDVVILGHDHRPRAETVTNVAGHQVQIINPGSGARNIAFAELRFIVSNNDKFELKDAKGKVLSLENTLPSASYVKTFQKDMKAIRKFANKPVGNLTHSLSAREGLFGSSAFTDLIHEVQLNITDADISFTAPLTVNENLEAGKLLVSDLFKLYRYENFLYVMELTGKEVKDFLEYSYVLWFNRMSSANDHLLNYRKDADGKEIVNSNGSLSLANPSFNFDSAAGIVYEVDVSKSAGERVTITGMENGQPFSESKTYKVAINSYRGSGGGGHLTAGAGIEHSKLNDRIIFTSESDIRSMLISYFGKQKTISPQPRNNWKVVPEEWWEKVKEREKSQ